jgi:hypothetical protein
MPQSPRSQTSRAPTFSLHDPRELSPFEVRPQSIEFAAVPDHAEFIVADLPRFEFAFNIRERK